MGAEAIKQLLDDVQLEKEVAELKEELNCKAKVILRHSPFRYSETFRH